jgi:small subunit ribosomal protein S18
MARPRNTRSKREDRDRRPKKKVSILDQESIEWVDYKDVNLLRRFMSERAKIRARRVTGNDAQQQRAVARAIRVAREMALLPYSVRQVTHRSKGGGRGREREGRLDLAMPTPPVDERGNGDEPVAMPDAADDVMSADAGDMAETAAESGSDTGAVDEETES